LHKYDMILQTCKELNKICKEMLATFVEADEAKLTLANKFHWTRANFAAYHGYLSQIIYAYDSGYKWNEETCAIAAMNGQLQILIYLHEHGCKWDSDTTARAAIGGHLSCLDYALANGCPLDNVAFSLAAKHGHVTVLQYLHEA